MTRKNLETSTDYENPYRPLLVRIFNSVGKLSESLGLSGSLNTEKLTAAATRKTGLRDFGDDGHSEALEVLVNSINEEADLTPTGRLIQKIRLASALVCRLRIEELLKQHPEINDINLGKIILITGLQRSGTTILHRLLNSHPSIRGVSGTEALNPLPPGSKAEEIITRNVQAVLAQRLISYLSPQFTAVHPVDHNEPEEDVMLLDLNFMSQTPEAIMHVPGYSRWLEQQDHTRTYEYFRKVLRILCWQRPTSNWVLKTPHHMEYLDVFLKVFPTATVVQTHRDPRKTMPSFCSMVAHNRGIFSDRVDPREIARHWSRKARRMVESAIRSRDKADADRFVDVSYYDLMNDPIAELHRIYLKAGVDFDAEAARQAETFMKKNPQNRFGRHVYHLSDFGLSEKIIEDHFSFYREKHKIPFE